MFMVILFSMLVPGTKQIYDFNKASDPSDWRVIDDGVMGGVSAGNISLNAEGHGVFYGDVSTKNYGGFSSIRHKTILTNIAECNFIILRVKGDGKKYQIRIKASSTDYFSYIHYFKTSKDWETIKIPLKDMYPSFRGRVLNMENFSSSAIEEVAILIGNKKDESFRLEIDEIYLN